MRGLQGPQRLGTRSDFPGPSLRFHSGHSKKYSKSHTLGTAPLSNSWILVIIWLYIAPNRTTNIDCYRVGAVPNLHPKP